MSELAAALAAAPSATFRVADVTAIESTGSRRVQTSLTGTTWISRDASVALAVGDRVWLLQQGNVTFVGGRLVGGVAQPIGAVTSFAGSTAPDGWLLCDGSAVSRTDYAQLFAVCGTTYGGGNGSTTFNLPNLANRVPVGPGNRSRGTTGGAETVTLTTAQMPGHDHGSAGGHQHTAPAYTTDDRTKSTNLFSTLLPSQSGTVNTSWNGEHTHSWVGGGQSHENMQPFIVLPYIIRAL